MCVTKMFLTMQSDLVYFYVHFTVKLKNLLLIVLKTCYYCVSVRMFNFCNMNNVVGGAGSLGYSRTRGLRQTASTVLS